MTYDVRKRIPKKSDPASENARKPETTGSMDDEVLDVVDLRAQMLEQLKNLREFMATEGKAKKEEFITKGTRFKDRQPLGWITTPIPSIDYVFAIQVADTDERPKINDVVLIYDQKYDEIYSGIISEFKVPKRKKSTSSSSTSDAIEILFGIKLLAQHESDLWNSTNIVTMLSESSFVYIANSEEIEAVYGISSNGVKLGICSHNGDFIKTPAGLLPYLLDPDLLKTHLYIGGITGQGKTILLKNILFELAQRKDLDPLVNTIVLDSQGDLVQVMKPIVDQAMQKYKASYDEMQLQPQGLESILGEDEVMFLKPFYVKVRGFLKLFPWRNFSLRSYRLQTGEQLANFIPSLTDKGRSTLVALFELFNKSVENFHFETFYQWISSTFSELENKEYRWYIPIANENGEVIDAPNQDECIEAPYQTAKAMLRELGRFRQLGIFDTMEEIDIEEILRKKVAFIYFPAVEGYATLRSIFLMDLLNSIYHKKVIEGLDVTVENGEEVNELQASESEIISDGNLEQENEEEPSDPTIFAQEMITKGGKDQEENQLANQHDLITQADDDEGVQGSIQEEGDQAVSKAQIINNLIMIDEAHELLPSHSKIADIPKDFFQYIGKEFQKIAKEGRKYGISLLVATQQVADLNDVVEQNAQIKIFFQLSPKDAKTIKLDKRIIDSVTKLKPGQAIVCSQSNMKISQDVEIRIVPPVFLHCDPDKASVYYKREIKEAIAARGEIEEKYIPMNKPPLITNSIASNKENQERVKIVDFLKALNLESVVSSRVTNLYNKSVLECDISLVKAALEEELVKIGLEGNHYIKVIEDIIVALKSEGTIGIKLLGPSGEGKTQFAFALVNAICIGGSKSFYAVSESTTESDLFFGHNIKALTDKEQAEYKLGIICQSLVHRTFPILDEANRAPNSIYGGKALTALGSGYITMPGEQLVQAPKDWRIVMIINPADIGVFKFPAALENRLMTIIIPYANDIAAKKVLETIIPDYPDVTNSFVKLRHETMKYSPLDKTYHYIAASERDAGDVRIHGISMRLLTRFGQQFKRYLEILEGDKRAAFQRTMDVIGPSLYVNDIPEEYDLVKKLVDAAMNGIKP